MWINVRQWGRLRGIDSVTPDTQYQRVLQEVVEIHEAMITEDNIEFQDAIGDTIVTLINLAATKGYKAEDCLAGAFDVIEKRKGLTTDKGDFIRYAKLDPYSKGVCDDQQGNIGNEYFTRDNLQPKDFKLRGSGGLI